jgi:hypothetical protein
MYVREGSALIILGVLYMYMYTSYIHMYIAFDDDES